jgi:conjugal transfer pilus assembly protein TraK
MTNLKLLALTLALMNSCNALASDIPIVPISVMKKELNAQVASYKAEAPIQAIKVGHIQAKPESSKKRKVGATTQKQTVVQITPGVNEIVAVAQNHLNRLITPFSSPQIKTVSKVTTEIKDNVIYFGVHKDVPVTLYITEKDDQSVALSLTLVPKLIPPREIYLKMDSAYASSSSTSFGKNTKPKKWEESQPYQQTIQKLFKTVALGDIPRGYNLADKAVGELPICRQSGLKFDFVKGQALVGHHVTMNIGTVRNISSNAIEFNETQCGNWDVIAVASFPLTVLLPGEKSEVYIAKKRTKQRSNQRKRPTLLN